MYSKRPFHNYVQVAIKSILYIFQILNDIILNFFDTINFPIWFRYLVSYWVRTQGILILMQNSSKPLRPNAIEFPKESCTSYQHRPKICVFGWCQNIHLWYISLSYLTLAGNAEEVLWYPSKNHGECFLRQGGTDHMFVFGTSRYWYLCLPLLRWQV